MVGEEPLASDLETKYCPQQTVEPLASDLETKYCPQQTVEPLASDLGIKYCLQQTVEPLASDLETKYCTQQTVEPLASELEIKYCPQQTVEPLASDLGIKYCLQQTVEPPPGTMNMHCPLTHDDMPTTHYSSGRPCPNKTGGEGDTGRFENTDCVAPPSLSYPISKAVELMTTAVNLGFGELETVSTPNNRKMQQFRKRPLDTLSDKTSNC